MKINNVSLELNRLKSGVQFYKFIESTNRNTTRKYILKDDELHCTISFTEIGDIIVGKIQLKIPNTPVRETDNLCTINPIKIFVDFDNEIVSYTAMYLHRSWWTRPYFGKCISDIPSKTQSLYIKNKSSYSYILPYVGDEFKTTISSSTDNIMIFNLSANVSGFNEVKETFVVMSTKKDFFDAVSSVFDYACNDKHILKKSQRKLPDMFNYLGWCSWDAFYTKMNEDKFLEKAKELNEKNVPVRWLLFDDGWLSIKDEKLTSFEPDSEKFPNGLKHVITKIKASTSIDNFGVWHTLAGYWGGIDESSQLAKKYCHNTYTTYNGKTLPYPSLHKGSKFFCDWYEYLCNEGINFVKVDGQSGVSNHFESNMPVCIAAKGSHNSLECAVESHMNNQLINCMGMAMENILSRENSPISRNSDDFVPDSKDGFKEHMLQNVYNAIYHNEVYHCDWDMFWSNHFDATRHSITRAISGSPVYISDKIGETNMDTILPLIYDDGEIIKFSNSAKPILSSVFKNPDETVLNISNDDGINFSVLSFNFTKQIATNTLSPSHLKGTKESEKYIIYDWHKRNYEIVTFNKCTYENLEPNELILKILIPYNEEISLIGLVDKYNTYLPIKSLSKTKNKYTFIVRGKGDFSLITKKKFNLFINENKANNTITAINNIHTFNIEKENSKIEINWQVKK